MKRTHEDADGGHSVQATQQLLRQQIISGEIRPGVISRASRAANLDVGRTPLREAPRMLEGEGLVRQDANKRLMIIGLSAEDAEEIYLMRVALESAAIRITVPILTSHDIAELEGLFAQMNFHVGRRDGDRFRQPIVPFMPSW